MATKFCRGILYTTGTTAYEPIIMLKFLYEFWGYCINGTASLSSPGGLAASSPVAPAISTNYTEGTSVIASGSDGYTVAGSNVFSSASATFNSSMVGKYLVMWKAGSGSSEDAIYPIIGFNNANQLRVNVNNGGTPDLTTLHPTFTNRTSINYRIVDMITNSTTALAPDASYIVFETDAPSVNAGQANSQFQIIIRRTGGTNRLGVVLSPKGTWSGANFDPDDFTAESTSNNWLNNFGQQTGNITIIGDKDFLMWHIKSPNISGATYHIEIPTRIYPVDRDPNPITQMSGFMEVSNTVVNYGNGFVMQNYDRTSSINHYLLTRSTFGDGTPSGVQVADWTGAVPAPLGPLGPYDGDQRFIINNQIGVLTSEGILQSIVNGQFSLARTRLRKVRFTGLVLQPYFRVTCNGDQYIYLTRGILWPWDNTVLPFNMMQAGF